jgi:hypothetical protein
LNGNNICMVSGYLCIQAYNLLSPLRS